MSVVEECLCGKKKINLNPTNWARHINACKTVKKKNSSSSLFTYFKKSTTPCSYSTEPSEPEFNVKKFKKTGKCYDVLPSL